LTWRPAADHIDSRDLGAIRQITFMNVVPEIEPIGFNRGIVPVSRKNGYKASVPQTEGQATRAAEQIRNRKLQIEQAQHNRSASAPPFMTRANLPRYPFAMEGFLRQFVPGGRFEGAPAARSRTMRAIKGSGNLTTEVRFRLALVRAGIRGWRVRPKGFPGTPDFVFDRRRVAIFADGCFWHGSQCGRSAVATNAAFWAEKLKLNRSKDRRTTRLLRKGGWIVFRVWEHEIRVPGIAEDAMFQSRNYATLVRHPHLLVFDRTQRDLKCLRKHLFLIWKPAAIELEEHREFLWPRVGSRDDKIEAVRSGKHPSWAGTMGT
jgi:DNA mismatch endonuclease (patch repair protein)